MIILILSTSGTQERSIPLINSPSVKTEGLLMFLSKKFDQYPTGIPVTIPVTVRIRGFAGIPVPAKFPFFAGIAYQDFTLN